MYGFGIVEKGFVDSVHGGEIGHCCGFHSQRKRSAARIHRLN